MRVVLSAALASGRSRIEARTTFPSLVGHGSDSDSALDSLRRSVHGWCAGLLARGELEVELDAHGVTCDAGSPNLIVEVTAQP